jgi:hypothetical protein
MITIAETAEYRKRAEVLLPTEERTAIINHLAMHPKSGVIMQGTGGIRKLRWARPGTGKSGGIRIIYFYHDTRMPLYLITMFGKSEKDNLSRSEQNILKKLVAALVTANGL